MIKVMLFDADGVILVGKSFSTYLKIFSGLQQNNIQSFFDTDFKKCLTGRSDIKKELIKYFKRWGWNTGVESFLSLWFQSEHKIDMKLIGYIQILRRNNIICSVATNQEKQRVKYMKSKMGFNKLFDKVYASSHLGYMKPDRNFFVKIMQNLISIQKKEVLFWDDSIEHVLAAKKFGINAEQYISYIDFQKKIQKYLV